MFLVFGIVSRFSIKLSISKFQTKLKLIISSRASEKCKFKHQIGVLKTKNTTIG